MLVIRQEQIQRFIAADEGQLVLVVSKALRAIDPERIKDYEDAKLAEMIKIGIACARSHQLERAEDITAYIALMFEIAPRFDEQKEIKQILSEPTFPPGERFYQLFERVSDEAWCEAQNLYEKEFWFPGAVEQANQ